MALDLESLSAKLLARCEEPTKASIIYGATGNLRAVQIPLGHSKIENTLRYLGFDVEGVLAFAENTEKSINRYLMMGRSRHRPARGLMADIRSFLPKLRSQKADLKAVAFVTGRENSRYRL